MRQMGKGVRNHARSVSHYLFSCTEPDKYAHRDKLLGTRWSGRYAMVEGVMIFMGFYLLVVKILKLTRDFEARHGS
jgi:hypothetical protein